MMINLSKPLEEDYGWLLLEKKTINDRTLICWYNPNDSIISLCLFHLEPINRLSQSSPETTWGYATKLVTGMYTEKEAAEVVGLYLNDMETANYWWELD
jgi:hypothetical protein